MDRTVVLDAPCIYSTSAQRAHQFSAGGPGHQQLVTPGSVPDDLDEVRQICGIGKLAPDLAIGTEPPIILEIIPINPVGCRLGTVTTCAAQPHHLGENDYGGGIGAIEQTAPSRVDQRITYNRQSRLS